MNPPSPPPRNLTEAEIELLEGCTVTLLSGMDWVYAVDESIELSALELQAFDGVDSAVFSSEAQGYGDLCSDFVQSLVEPLLRVSAEAGGEIADVLKSWAEHGYGVNGWMLEFPENSGEEPLEGGGGFSTSLGESIWLGEGTYYDPDCKTLTEEQVAFLEGGRLTIRIDEAEAESRGLRPGITFCFENGNARPTADWSLFDPYDRCHPLTKINVEPLWEEGASDDDDEQYLETEEPKAMLQSLTKNLLYAYAGHSGFWLG